METPAAAWPRSTLAPESAVPLLLDMAGTPVVCIGAGPVVAAKALPLQRAGAAVTVIAPTVHADLAALAVETARRRYVDGDLDHDPPFRLAIVGTADADADAAAAGEAARRGIWCLRVDGRGDVAATAVLRDGDLVVAVASGAPALTSRLRSHLEETLAPRWTQAAAVLAALRRDAGVAAALAAVDPTARRRRWRRAVDAALDDPDPAGLREILHDG